MESLDVRSNKGSIKLNDPVSRPAPVLNKREGSLAGTTECTESGANAVDIDNLNMQKKIIFLIQF